MSHVANVILLTALGDGAQAVKLSAYLEDGYNGSKLTKVSEHVVGPRVMERDVFIAAVNYLDIDAFVVAFIAVEWDYPECVQLLISDDAWGRFRTYVPAGQALSDYDDGWAAGYAMAKEDE